MQTKQALVHVFRSFSPSNGNAWLGCCGLLFRRGFAGGGRPLMRDFTIHRHVHTTTTSFFNRLSDFFPIAPEGAAGQGFTEVARRTCVRALDQCVHHRAYSVPFSVWSDWARTLESSCVFSAATHLSSPDSTVYTT